MEKNLLTLKSCAYLWHWSHSDSSIDSPSQCSEKLRIRSILEGLSKATDKGRTFEYVYKIGERQDKATININGDEIEVDDRMILSVNGKHPRKNIINGIRFKPLFPIKYNADEGDYGRFCQYITDDALYGGVLKRYWIDSLYEGLRYYVLHFNGCCCMFVVSGHKLYDFADTYQKITIDDIIRRCGADSQYSKNLIKKALAYLCE